MDFIFFKENSNYIKKENLLDNDKNKKIDLLLKEIEFLENDISQINIKPISQILKENSEEDLYEELKSEEETIRKSHYFPLIKFLISEGLIDEAYYEYLGHFYESSLGRNDATFLRELFSGSILNEDFTLENPEIVISKLKPNDYKRPGIYNHSIMKATLWDSDNSIFYAKIIETTLNNENKINSLFKFLKSLKMEDISNSVKLILEFNFDLYWKVLNESAEMSKLSSDLLIMAYKNIDLIIDKTKNIRKLNSYLSNRADVLENNYLINNSNILDNMASADVKFKDLTQMSLSSDLANKLESNAMFYLNISNVIKISKVILKENSDFVLTTLLKKLYQDDKFQITKEQVNNDLERFVKEYIDTLLKKEKTAASGKKAMIKILNSDIDNDVKNNFLFVETSKIPLLSEISDYSLYQELIDQSLVKYDEENIQIYYDKYSADQTLINYMNSFIKNKEIIDISKELANTLLNSEEINENLFDVSLTHSDVALEEVNSKLLVEKHSDRIKKLLENNKLGLSTSNLLSIQKLNNDDFFVEYLNQFEESINDLLLKKSVCSKLSKQTIETILERKSLDRENSLKLLECTEKEINLKNIFNAHRQVKSHVLKKQLTKEQLQNIIVNNINYKFWDSYIDVLNDNLDVVSKTMKLNLNSKFIDELMSSETLYESRKIIILAEIVKISKYKKYKDFWNNWMRISNSKELLELATIFDNKRPDYPEGIKEMEQLVDALIEIDVLTKGKNNKLHFKPTNFDKLY